MAAQLDPDRLLRLALLAFGFGLFLVYPLAWLWPAAWSWHHANPQAHNYFLMIVGVYATLGLFLIRAARDPAAHRSLIWFTAWSSVVHGLIMAGQAAADRGLHAHFLGDVPAMLLTGVVLGILMRRFEAGRGSNAAAD